MRSIDSIARHLFPDVGPVTAAAMFHGLDGAPEVPRDPAPWTNEVKTLLAHRLSGLALRAARTTGVDLPADVQQRLERDHRLLTATSLRMEALAVDILARVDEAGIPGVITKGPGIARFYPDPGLRPFRDVDLFVGASGWDAACALLERNGFSVPDVFAEPRDFFFHLCRESVNFTRADTASVDLHNHVPPWIWGESLDVGVLVGAAEDLTLPHGTIRIASPVHNLLIAALHIVSDGNHAGRSLLPWRDVLTLCGALDPGVVAAEAAQLQLTWWLRMILNQVPEPVRPVHVLAKLQDATPNRRDLARLARLLPPGIGAELLAPVFRLPIANATAYLVGYTFPSLRFRRIQNVESPSLMDWWRSSSKRLRQRRATS